MPTLTRSTELDLSIFDRTDVDNFREPSALLIHETIRKEGERELERPRRDLMWSGIAGGFAIALSVIAKGFIEAKLPEAGWLPLVSGLGFTLGFLVIILGRQGSIAESSLTGVLPVLSSPVRRKIQKMLSLWSVIIVANLIGVFLMSAVLALTSVLEPDVRSTISESGARMLAEGPMSTFLRALFAGWIIALAVWTAAAARSSKTAIVFTLVYLTSVLGFHHLLAGSTTVMVSAWSCSVGWGEYLLSFLLPVLIGNIIGGAGRVAALNRAQVAREQANRLAMSRSA